MFLLFSDIPIAKVFDIPASARDFPESSGKVAGKGEGWYIIMAVFSDILYKTSDKACCYHRLLLILCNESTNDTLQQMSLHVNS